MSKVHDKYVVELAETIKGYGNDPDINDPFCLSEFYRFYEVPNVCVSAENFKKMRPLSDYTEEIEPGSISEWKKEFREYVDSLDIARDDWKGIIEYIDELPSAEPDTTTHDSNVVKKGGNDEDRISGDCISRQAAIDAICEHGTDLERRGITVLAVANHKQATVDLLENLPSAQPEQRWIPCSERLPEDFQKVLVFWWEHSEPMIDTAFWQKDAKRFDGQHWVRMEDKVTHWMPLPKPPAFNEVEE